MLLDTLAVLYEKKRAPPLRVVELAPLVDGRAWCHGNVRHELIRGPRERCLRFGADLAGLRIKSVQPRIVLPIDKLDRGKPREKQEGRLGCERAALAEHAVKASIEALE